ncbi:MAG TPA: ABC transporter ATP-binding protein [Candidatus Dependentiae bacterium]|nr:ABC transporter ATP-binding protein [Candidatus Dependentiae bacterium]HRQ62705.1 ABC transporter ATP-binding protein [Candidatus Dependentiae bacterium]
MKSIKLDNISKSFHGELILENTSLTIPKGTFFALLGPSGSGKTTILRLIAGLEQPDKGHIFMGDEDITHVPLNERRINTVFQNYALFPHMNVFDNVAYSLHLKKVPAEEIERKVTKILKTVHLEKHMYKSIDQLSGGQQQRVALARAIVNEPEVLLLDEPLAALDLKLRERMLIELIDLQGELKTTFIYVTHDQFEALTVADQMAIMNADGEIEQVGTPRQIYEFPISSFVAQFVGTTNIFKGVLHRTPTGDYLEVEGLGQLSVVVRPEMTWAQNGSTVFMSLRPEKICISKKPLEGFSNHLKGVVRALVYYGRSTQYNVQLSNGMIVHVFEQNEEHFTKDVIDYDDEVYVYWQKENVVLLER